MHANVMTEASRQPVVSIIDGEAMADSRDVAAYFEKPHRTVLEAIDNLLKQEPDLGLRNFLQTPYVEAQNGQTYRCFRMTRDGFVLLAMGFTGSKALRFKLAYIEAFNAMEAELRNRRPPDPMLVLNDPAAMRGILPTYTEKVLALEGQLEEMKPQVEALDRIAEAHGSFCRSTAAKMLQIPPHTLIRWLRTNGWTFRRPGDKDDLAYQSKIAAGYLEHKVTTGQRPDGADWTSTQVRITPKGLTVLAKAFPPAVSAA